MQDRKLIIWGLLPFIEAVFILVMVFAWDALGQKHDGLFTASAVFLCILGIVSAYKIEK